MKERNLPRKCKWQSDRGQCENMECGAPQNMEMWSFKEDNGSALALPQSDSVNK